jgi:hypothetical protein
VAGRENPPAAPVVAGSGVRTALDDAAGARASGVRSVAIRIRLLGGDLGLARGPGVRDRRELRPVGHQCRRLPQLLAPGRGSGAGP